VQMRLFVMKRGRHLRRLEVGVSLPRGAAVQ
jgi:hypothetical protein